MIINNDFTYHDLKIIILEEVDSTNTFAKKYPFKKDGLVLSSHQTAGKGRYQRSFYSPKDKGIYFSLVLHDLNLSAQLYTIIMGIAISKYIKNSHIKYLNDVLIGAKKVSGILCEGVIVGNKYQKMIIGVGINLFETEVPNELKDIMTFINDKDLNVTSFITNILDTFYELLKLDNNQIIEYYKNLCSTLNKWVVIDAQDYYCLDINSEGHLICLDENNNQVKFSNAEVSFHPNK